MRGPHKTHFLAENAMRIAVSFGWALAGVWAAGVAQLTAADEKPSIVVKFIAESPTSGIQEAIDALPPSGGVVTIPAGEYLLRQSIRVGSNVTLQGAGTATVLGKTKQAGSKLAAAVGEQERSLRVESAAGLTVGDEIGIFDHATVGWLHAHAIIKEIRGDELLLNRRVGRAFDPAKGGAVINYFPAISGRDVSKVVLKDLTIDGQAAENPGPALVCERPKGTPQDLGFTFAAVDLIRVADSRVENVRVKGWPADGISVQGQGAVQGKYRGNVVTKCYVENCRGPGFHAGGRLEDSEFVNNEARHNLGDGFYFCAWVTRITVRNNKFIGNQANGVGGLGDSGDIDNVVEGNLCEANGKAGIFLWDGERNTVKNNTCVNNSQSSPGRFSGIVLTATSGSIVSGNCCLDNQPTKTQKHGIEELANCRGNTVTGNESQGSAAAGFALLGKDGQYSANRK
jgi:parallel beta-helix repeat protein